MIFLTIAVIMLSALLSFLDLTFIDETLKFISDKENEHGDLR